MKITSSKKVKPRCPQRELVVFHMLRKVRANKLVLMATLFFQV
jgi:hypothetical protein